MGEAKQPLPGSQRVPHLSARLQGLGVSIFAEMSALAADTGAINLGQGFPDADGPLEVADAAVAAIRAGVNQYPPGPGLQVLREAIARHQQRFYAQAFDPDREVLVTAGATEAITAAVIALCEVGDEVLTFEPAYDSYAAAAAIAGAKLVTVPLRAPSWTFDPEELSAAVTPRTRLLLLNTPHNPTGKVFTKSELEAVAKVCTDSGLLAVTDEVYEHLVFEGKHRLLAAEDGMRERTVTVSSAGKTFSFTGWKVGWACGPADLIAAVRTVKQFLTYVNGAPFQPAVATGLDLGDDVYDSLASQLRSKRDLLCGGLTECGFDPIAPAATYFVMAATERLGVVDAAAFCRSLPSSHGVAAVPASAFYPSGGGEGYVRFAFCKQEAVLTEALRRLAPLPLGQASGSSA